MKKFSIALILTLGIIISLFSVVSADDTSKYFTSDGTAYEWSFNESSGELTISKVYPSGNYTSNDYSSVASRIKSINIKGIHQYTDPAKYEFSNFPSGLNSLKSITVNGKCQILGSLKNCPSLNTITFNGNNRESKTTLDLTARSSSTFPTISYDNNNRATYYLDYSDFRRDSVTVPKSYGTNAKITYSFKNSASLSNTVSFESGTTTIPENAFENCKNLTSINIPSGVETIDYAAFYGCESVKKVTIPASVKKLCYNAFYKSGITEVKYLGTIENWYSIVKTYSENGQQIQGNILYLDNAVIHCNDGDLHVSKIPNTDRYEYKQHLVGWKKDTKSGLWSYYDEDGNMVKNTTRLIDYEYYHFNVDGIMITGWNKENGKWYFYDKSSGKMQRSTWVKDDGKWYYMDSNGVMATGKKYIKGVDYYFNSSGVMATGWTKIGDYWYYFETNGSMCVGWKKIDGKWYYLCEKNYAPSSDNIGCMAVGRMKIDGYVYYFASSGVMQTGWVHIGNDWYYFDSKGHRQSGGWLQDGNNWYYLNEDGTMYCGWLKYNNNWYYLQHSGVMATSQITIEGRGYIFQSDGICINPY